ncbi:hypothetical protein J6590_007093 [Homalodisca vitripennis]|nr:hypothetical protein J6590_007093 [Homalodisca vitripennis]
MSLVNFRPTPTNADCHGESWLGPEDVTLPRDRGYGTRDPAAEDVRHLSFCLLLRLRVAILLSPADNRSLSRPYLIITPLPCVSSSCCQEQERKHRSSVKYQMKIYIYNPGCPNNVSTSVA